MKTPDPGMSRMLRALGLLFVVSAGLLSILGTGSGSSDDSSDPVGAIACAGRDQQVKTGSLVYLDASCSDLTDEAPADDYLNVSWQFSEIPSGSSASLSSRVVINPTFTADLEGVYRLKLQARADSLNARDQDEVVVTATTGNSPPVAHAGYAFHLKVGDDAVLDGSRSADADGDLITYAWQPDAVTPPVLVGEDTPKPGFSLPSPGRYAFLLTVNDGALDSARDPVAVRVTSDGENACPDADAGPDQRVATGSLVTLDASASRDADGDLLAYEWRMIYRPTDSNAELDAPINNATPTFTPDVVGAYVIKLTALDADTNLGRTVNCVDRPMDTRDIVTVIASSGNSGPVADAGVDQVVDPGDTVQLNGGGSSDADGDPLAYAWSFVSLPPTSTALLSDATAADPTFVADVAGSYVLLLAVSDGVQSDSDTLVVEATDGTPGPTRPVADAGADQIVAVGATATLDGSGSSDPNGDPLTYLWTFIDWPGAPAGLPPVLSDETAVGPSFVAADAGNYVLRLVVSDGAEDSIGDTVTVTAQAAGACADPLTLVTALPFQPGVGEGATVIQIDGDNLSAVAADLPSGIDAIQVTNAGPGMLDQANFDVLGPAWSEFSRSLFNPISDSESPSFVIQRTADNVYFRIDVEFTGEPVLQEVLIDALTGCRCGADPGNCP